MAHEILHESRSKTLLLTCLLLQQNSITSDQKNNIVTYSSDCDIIVDHQLKTHDVRKARVKFLKETGIERV